MNNRDPLCLGHQAKIVLLNGGLGNQICQYIFLRWLEIKGGEPCLADDSDFCTAHHLHNGYELERIFGVNIKRLSQHVLLSDWERLMHYYPHVGICQQLYNMGYPLTLLAEADDFCFDGNVVYTSSYEPRVARARGFLYFHGYWLHNFYFKDIKDTIRQELTFPKITDEKNIAYAKAIQNSQSLCIHIRRGDFVERDWDLPPAMYKEAIDIIEERLGKGYMHYFVFSDDIDYCQRHAREYGLPDDGDSLTFVEGNSGENSYIDMQLMTMCHHMIVSNSSFSYLAALLRKRDDGFLMGIGHDRPLV